MRNPYALQPACDSFRFRCRIVAFQVTPRHLRTWLLRLSSDYDPVSLSLFIVALE
jgi:hypothetical protein